MKIPAYIIGKQGSFRNPDLTVQLQNNFYLVEQNGFVEKELVNPKFSFDTAKFKMTTGRTPSLGELACSVAHFEAWRYLAESEHPCLAVFEDDAKLIPTQRTLNQVISLLLVKPGSWIANLERRPGDYLVTHLVSSFFSPLKRSFVPPRGAGAYIISKEAASRLIKEIQDSGFKFEGPNDNSLPVSKLVNYWLATPPVFEVLPEAKSLIDSEEITRDKRRISTDFSTRIAQFLYLVLQNGQISKDQHYSYLWLRPLKYYLSIHFYTFWLTRRFKTKK